MSVKAVSGQSDRAIFVHGAELEKYRFAPDHPFQPVRYALIESLLVTCGLLTDDDIVKPRAASRADLLLVHDEAYVKAVEECRTDPERFGLGSDDNPVFADMHQAAALGAGAALMAAQTVMMGKATHAFVPAGGMHHAQRAAASGFCVYNDAAIAIARLRRDCGARVAYVDTDAHHGDGVQWAFYDERDVLTVSFHESGRYLFPGTGEPSERGVGGGYGYAVNVPLEPFTGDESFLEVFEQVVVPLVEAFAPDILITQNGCDGHFLDPLAQLNLTMKSYRLIPAIEHELAHRVCGGRWVALGGGGYDTYRVVPRAWALLWAEMSGRKLPETLPLAWLLEWQPRASVVIPDRWEDDPREVPSNYRRATISAKNARTARRALAGSFLDAREGTVRGEGGGKAWE